VRLERRIGRLSAGIMERLKDALAFALDLELWNGLLENSHADQADVFTPSRKSSRIAYRAPRLALEQRYQLPHRDILAGHAYVAIIRHD
jgi:hypothetical protein